MTIFRAARASRSESAAVAVAREERTPSLRTAARDPDARTAVAQADQLGSTTNHTPTAGTSPSLR